MLNNHLIEQISLFTTAAKKTACKEELDSILLRLFKEFGAEMFSYFHLPPLGAMDYKPSHVVSYYGFPNSWCQFYCNNRYCEDDPLLAYVFKKNQAVKWEEFIQSAMKLPEHTDYVNCIRNLTVSIGWAFPVFGALGRSGVFSLGFGNNCSSLQDLELSMLQWVCQTAHYRYIDFITETLTLSNQLTPREIDVIRYISQGKSVKQISNILGISSHTIQSYLKSIYLKLGVTDRVNASFRAASLGIV